MGQYFKIFFSETTEPIENKLVWEAPGGRLQISILCLSEIQHGRHHASRHSFNIVSTLWENT